ncbi:hypothetical protein Q4493_11475 [Colwellia sp. 1_MG-2023]|uniref:hypothetical protein n=1 Tax=Colwellia sp. 1_MG-2023 TaxID=3062649 RepID=UPI0026E42C19|nr:hypothetical protein [Colwellia sp. 1_MG-2023]MDO6446393.1 hypothetical protein [Colwellia sp. 1_MG-2023]
MEEHGSYDLAIEEKTHILKAYGSWNFETAKKWGAETKAILNGIIDKPWVCLVDLSQWELATPDIRTYVHDFNLWLNENNLKYLAVVYSLHLQVEVLKITHVVLTNVEIKYFDNHKDANEWLNSIEL